MRSEEKEILTNTFVYASFNYCLLVWYFCPVNSLRNIEKIRERAYILENSYILEN